MMMAMNGTSRKSIFHNALSMTDLPDFRRSRNPAVRLITVADLQKQHRMLLAILIFQLLTMLIVMSIRR